MPTEAELGYSDAIRQVERILQRRLKTLKDTQKDESYETEQERLTRLSEVEHVLGIVESLRR